MNLASAWWLRCSLMGSLGTELALLLEVLARLVRRRKTLEKLVLEVGPGASVCGKFKIGLLQYISRLLASYINSFVHTGVWVNL